MKLVEADSNLDKSHDRVELGLAELQQGSDKVLGLSGLRGEKMDSSKNHDLTDGGKSVEKERR
jgi:hypothetical protein